MIRREKKYEFSLIISLESLINQSVSVTTAKAIPALNNNLKFFLAYGFVIYGVQDAISQITLVNNKFVVCVFLDDLRRI